MKKILKNPETEKRFFWLKKLIFIKIFMIKNNNYLL